MYTPEEAEAAEDTVSAIRDDLDNYGGHIRVLIEARDGDAWYEVGTIGTTTVDGETVVVIATGDRAA